MGYPPPLVLNVEPISDLHRFLELMVNTAGGDFSCRLWNPVVQALRSGDSGEQDLVLFISYEC